MLLRTYTPVAKSIARYTALGSPAEHCGICRFYAAPNICARVLGPVVPAGWCKFFSKEAVFRPLWPYAGAGAPSLDMSFTTPGTMPSGVTFTRASAAKYFNSAGTMQSAAANAPRWDYNPTSHALNGLLVEEARTNLWLQSGDLSQASPVGIGGPAAPSATANQTTAPDGTLTAASVAFPAISAGATSVLYQQLTVTAAPATFSVWMKGSAGGEQLYLGANGGAGTYVNSPRITLTTAWQRFSFTTTTTAGAWFFDIGADMRGGTAAATPSQGTYIWGAQVEQGAFATSYIATAAAAATRAADLASMPTSTWFTAANGTYQAEFILNGVASGLPIIIGGNAGSPTIATGADSRLTAGIRSGASVFSATGPLYTFGAVNKAAFAYLSGASNAAVNGTAFGPNATAFTVTGTVAELGSDGVTPGNNALNGWLRRVRYWPRALAAAELQSVTT